MEFEDYNIEEKITDPELNILDIDEASLRPTRWEEYYGQKKQKIILKFILKLQNKDRNP